MIECTIHIAFEVFCQTIQAVYGVAESAIVVASIAAIVGVLILGIASSPLGSRCDRQAKSQDCRSEQ